MALDKKRRRKEEEICRELLILKYANAVNKKIKNKK